MRVNTTGKTFSEALILPNQYPHFEFLNIDMIYFSVRTIIMCHNGTWRFKTDKKVQTLREWKFNVNS